MTAYVHGIRVAADEPRWNIALEGTLCSPDGYAAVDPGLAAAHISARDIALDDLHDRAYTYAGVLSARGLAVYQASMLRAGMTVGYGAPPYPFRALTEAERKRTLAQADLELAVEEVRRHVRPEAPSRLSCLWVADDTLTGRNFVHRLVGPEAFLLRVEIAVALRKARLDAHWLGRRPLADLGDREFEGYWSGEALDHEPLWETLMDGCIRAIDDDELERLRRFAAEHGHRSLGDTIKRADTGSQ